MKKEKLLVLRLSALGDVAMTVPVIYSVAEKYPDLEIYVLTRPFFSRIFICRPSNVHLIEADLAGRHKGAAGTMKLMIELAAQHFDYVADLHNVLRTWIIDRRLALGGAKVEMVDKMRSDRRRLLKGHKNGSHPSFISRYFDVFSRLGFPAELTFRSIFDKSDIPAPPIAIDHPAVGIAPYARYYNKQYPSDRMDSVVAELAALGYHIYLFGGRGNEAEALSRLAARYEGCTSVAGHYDLRQELAMMAHMDLMISMDSANPHLAALVGTRVLTIWGSTTPACGFTPHRHSADDGICLDLSCQPCSIAGGIDCPNSHFSCMRSIDPNTIVKRAVSILNPDSDD